jgi:hypothetical protein
MPNYAGKTVAEILKRYKQGYIKQVPLPKGSPSWDDIMNLTWEEVVRRARKREPSFTTFKKLLIDQRFDK